MIYHITTRGEWAAAQKSGIYRAASQESEGFIHCSTWRQVLPVANRFYRGRGDLLLLCIDESRLQSPLVWEAPAQPDPDMAKFAASNEQFPHIYGEINLDAVVAVESLRESNDGFALA
ncbi:MAG: DUF952 domain-containing protein [Chloroflexi bacterium]|nr:DUF952 domain-containing protein [Chloroflexota bacterium]